MGNLEREGLFRSRQHFNENEARGRQFRAAQLQGVRVGRISANTCELGSSTPYRTAHPGRRGVIVNRESNLFRDLKVHDFIREAGQLPYDVVAASCGLFDVFEV